MRVLADAVGPALEEVLSKMGIAGEVWTGLLGPATVEEHGDLALLCHRLAGTLHRSPNDIAADNPKVVAQLKKLMIQEHTRSEFYPIKPLD